MKYRTQGGRIKNVALRKACAIHFLSSIALSGAALLIPIMAAELGASPFQIGLIGVSYGMSIFLASFIFGRAADVHGQKIFLRLGLGLCIVACIVQIFAFDPLSLALSRAMLGFCAGIYPAALTAYVYEMRKRALGKFASFGSLGFGLGSFVAGLISIYWCIFLACSLLFLLAFLLTLGLGFRHEQILMVPLFPLQLIRRTFHVYAAVLIRHTGASAIWLIYPLYIQGLGGSTLWIGILYLINTGGQFFVMQLIERFRSAALVPVGMLLSALTFFSFTLATKEWHLIPSQILLACSWSCMYVGALKYVMERNIEHATAMGLFGSTLSISGLLGPLLGGCVADVVAAYLGLMSAYRAIMYLAAMMALGAATIFLFAERKRRWTG